MPIFVVHGGPGFGCYPVNRRYFDPQAYQIIQMDQRGCGKSTPHAELGENNTLALVEDMETLRKFLRIDSWYIFGGSWGSTLGLVYAIHHPHRVKALILRGIFLCTPSEISWFNQPGGAPQIFPENYQRFKHFIPENERDDLLKAYYTRLTSDDLVIRREACKEWCLWEMSCIALLPSQDYLDKALDLDIAASVARFESHYFVHLMFLEENFILKHAGEALKNVPMDIVHGRYDVICPMDSAWKLHQRVPHSALHIIANAGHSSAELGIAEKLVEITNKYRSVQ